jgi:hypothetical protein
MAQVATRQGSARTGAGAGSGSSIVAAGLTVGIAGGLAMAAYMVVSAAYNGHGLLDPLRPLGATFTETEDPSGAARFLYGMLLHLSVSALLAVLLLAVLPAGMPAKAGAVVGIGYSWFIMAMMTTLILRAVNPHMRYEMTTLGGSWVIAHALYGIVIGFGPRLRAGGRLRR